MKILNTLFAVTHSTNPTPSPGFGSIFASGSFIYSTSSLGITNLVGSPLGGGSASFTLYTSSGTYTYNTGSNIQYIKVVCAGGGGGGGGGRLGLASSNRAGGGGGAGGNINVATFSSSSLTTGSYTITVGTGGSGGLGRSGAVSFTGGDGNAGTDSTFASGSTILLRGVGGPAGGGGSTVPGTAGTNVAPTTATVPNPLPPFYFSGTNGNAGSTTVPTTNAGDAFNGSRFLGGGGGGGGINNANTSGNGGSGSAIYNFITLIQSGSPGSTAGTRAGQNGAPVIDISQLFYYSGSNITLGRLVGTGGHGGAGGNNSPAASAGNGGSGSAAAGGGGGGGTIVNVTSGFGGRGGDGFVIIFEYY